MRYFAYFSIAFVVIGSVDVYSIEHNFFKLFNITEERNELNLFNLKQAARFLNFTAQSFDHKLFLTEVRYCSKFMYYSDRYRGCMWLNHVNFGATSSHWQPEIDPLLSPNCEYMTSSFRLHQNLFTFEISQFDCRNRSFSMYGEGGSSFEIILRVNSTLATCAVMDHFNSSYTIRCPINHIRFAQLSGAQISMYISVILSYEHFTAFSDHRRQPLHHIITDNQQVTLPNDLEFTPTSSAQIQPPNLGGSCPGVVWFDARWSRELQTGATYPYPLPPFARWAISHDNRSALPLSLPTFVPQKDSSYQWTITKKSSCSETVVDVARDMANDCLRKLINTTVDDKDRVLLFIGDSHMRYNIDFYLGEVFGQDYLKTLSTRHEHVAAKKPFAYKAMRHAAASEQAIRRFCEEQREVVAANGHTSKETTTIVFQTGHWDLANSSPRYPLYDDEGADRLARVLEELLTGALDCGRIERIVWVTAVPYPLCVNDEELSCAENSGYRNNAALAAMNEYYLQRLLSVSRGRQSISELRNVSDVSFVVVDAFNILYPRLFMTETEEVVCHNHFLCRPSNAEMVVTPGGVAVVEAMKWALCL